MFLKSKMKSELHKMWVKTINIRGIRTNAELISTIFPIIITIKARAQIPFKTMKIQINVLVTLKHVIY